MGFVGLVALALVVAGPPARRARRRDRWPRVTTRLARVAVVLGVLAVPAVLTDLAHDASERGGYDYGAAWDSLYDGTNAGRLSGLEVTLSLVGAALVAPLRVRRSRPDGRGLAARRRAWRPGRSRSARPSSRPRCPTTGAGAGLRDPHVDAAPARRRDLAGRAGRAAAARAARRDRRRPTAARSGRRRSGASRPSR